MKKLIVFDLDGTLAPSKSSLAPQTAAQLRDLLGIIKVAVISGGAWAQFEKQLLTDLPPDSHLANLSLLPTCGTKFFQYNGKWTELYSEDLTPEQKKKIIDSLDKAAGEAGYRARKVWGKVIEDRGSQVTFSALGQQAPLAEKEKWDADLAKRKKITAILETLMYREFPRLCRGGSSSLTFPGVHPETLRGEPPSTHQGETGWTSMKA